MTTITDCSSTMKAAGGGSYTASGQHSGLDFNGASLTGKRQLVRRLTVETSGVGKKRRVTMRTKRAPANTMNTSNVRTEEQIYDKHLLANQGNQRLTSLAMKAGSRLGHIDRFGPFLKNLQQNGRITMAWNGSMKTELDKRHVSMQIFRHSLSDNDANTTQSAYPHDGTNYIPHILYPNSQQPLNKLYIPNATGIPETGDVIKNPFYTHLDGQVSFAPLNLPDMEDMSWNLNKLKLAASDLNHADFDTVTGTVTTTGAAGTYDLVDGIVATKVAPKWDQNVPNYAYNAHRRQSVLRQNNFLAISTGTSLNPNPDPETADKKASNYLYDACIRYGTIQYEFMNKQDVGATVEVILYKVKQTNQCSALSSAYQTDVTLNQNAGTEKAVYPLSILVDSVSKGYINTVGQDYATENFTGRQPDYLDVYNNPNYPLLPNKLKKTVEGENPLSEVMRNKFIMTAGSRRNLTLNLPGLLYNPASKPNLNEPTDISDDQLPSSSVAICDKDTYCVVLSCNGQKMTRFFDNLPKSYTPEGPAGPSSSTTAGVIDSWRLNYDIGGAPSTSYDVWLPDNMMDEYGNDAYPVGDTLKLYIISQGGGIAAQITSVNTITQELAPPTGAPANYTRQIAYLTPPPSFADQYIMNFPGTLFLETGSYPLNCRVNSPNGPLYNIFQTDGASWALYQPTISILSLVPVTVTPGTPGTPEVPAQKPEEVAMGDNHGISHIDYCATYTEHIGACVYKEKKERNLFDCGNPEPPELTVPNTTGSVVSSRMILPAVNVVRQAKRVGYGVDSTGAATNISIEEATDNN